MSGTADHIVLSGPPGVGKTTIARRAAERLSRRALDLDALIEGRTGRTPGTIIREDGEACFREHEAEALRTLVGPPAVIALGGGTLTTEKGRTAARALGPVLGLDAPFERLRERLTASAIDRPLIAGDESGARLAKLLEARRSTYAAVDKVIGADAAEEAVAARVAESASQLAVLHVELESRRSRIVVGHGLADAVRGAVSALAPSRKVLCVVDTGVPAALRERYLHSVASLVAIERVELEGGEGVKTWTVLGEVLERALAAGCGRQSAVVAIGGGAVCDLAGLAAALLGRGAPLVLVPTTLLSQADASIGGKCAVNMAGGRNLVGAFHPATDVVCDLEALESLPEREYRSGLAEVLKMGVITDASLWDTLVERKQVDAPLLARAIGHKGAIVASDPYEKGARKVLNLGHTLGHALESASGFTLPHGEAVAIGMAAIARLSARRGWCTPDTAERIVRGLGAAGLATEAPPALLSRCAPFLSLDKKGDGRSLDLVVVQEVGKVSWMRLSLAEIVDDLVRSGGAT